MSGIEYAFETFCELSQYYADQSKAYRYHATHVTSADVKESGRSRKFLSKHYRQMAHKAEVKAQQNSHKADRWLAQL